MDVSGGWRDKKEARAAGIQAIETMNNPCPGLALVPNGCIGSRMTMTFIY